MIFTPLLLTLGLATAAVLPIGPEPVGPEPIHLSLLPTHAHTTKTKSLTPKPTASRLPLPFPLTNMTWIAPKEMGNISFHGPHDVVGAQIAALKPIWHTNATHLQQMVARGVEDAVLENELSKRDSARYTQYCMQSQYEAAAFDTSIANYESIYRRFGTGTCQTAAKSCARFSCQWDNAIVMCNDGPAPVTIPCAELAQNAAFIVGFCLDGSQTEGQAFYNNPSYNVLVKIVDEGNSC